MCPHADCVRYAVCVCVFACACMCMCVHVIVCTCAACQAFPGDADVCSSGCGALLGLSGNLDAAAQIDTLGGIQPLLLAMQTHSKHESIQLCSLNALYNLCYQSDQLKVRDNVYICVFSVCLC